MAKKNLVYIPAFNDFLKWHIGCKESWEYYCRKYDIDLIIDQKNSEPFVEYMPQWVHGCYLKWLNKDIYQRDYDKILMVDCDTIVSPYAPNIFDETVDIYPMFAGRLDLDQRIRYEWYYELMEVDLFVPKDRRYFNVGVCCMSQETYNIIYQNIFPYYVHDAQLQLKVGRGPVAPDQTCVNQIVHKDIEQIHELDPKWNDLVITKQWQISDQSYIWHFAGVCHTVKQKVMTQVWNQIGHLYKS